jgi:hypothetical protein
MIKSKIIQFGVARILGVLFLGFLAYIFTGAYWLPPITPHQAGVSWQECKVDGFIDSPNWQKLQECFAVYPQKEAYANFIQKKDILHSPFTLVYSPWRLNGHPIFVEKLGFKYYVNYRGQKMGPVFDEVFTESCCEYGLYSITPGEDYYAFRGKRAGKYYLVMIRVLPEAAGQ